MPNDAMPSTTPSSVKSSKTKSLMVTFKLSPSALAPFPAEIMPRKTIKLKPSIAVSAPDEGTKLAISQDEVKTDAAIPASDAAPKAEDTDSLATPQTNGTKRKATSANGPAAPKKDKADEDGASKPRGKPGPKRRKGGAEGEVGAAPAHKLGPKANQGAINAQLRALDRTGKPSRRWQRAPFSFTSFTGHKWELPQWNTAKLDGPETSNDAQSENTGSSENKGMPSSAVQSIDGQMAGTPGMELASSPPVLMDEVTVG